MNSIALLRHFGGQEKKVKSWGRSRKNQAAPNNSNDQQQKFDL
jgi:hypothetical protein